VECEGLVTVYVLVWQAVRWTDGKCSMPTSCPAAECRSRTFAARRTHSLTDTIDWQTIRYSVVAILCFWLFIATITVCLHEFIDYNEGRILFIITSDQ